jgi:hypothetical protein
MPNLSSIDWAILIVFAIWIAIAVAIGCYYGASSALDFLKANTARRP